MFAPVVAQYLRRIEYGKDGWPVRLVSPATDRPVMVVDPTLSFGQPIFIHGAARIEDVLDRWRAGDALTEVAEDFGVFTLVRGDLRAQEQTDRFLRNGAVIAAPAVKAGPAVYAVHARRVERLFR